MNSWDFLGLDGDIPQAADGGGTTGGVFVDEEGNIVVITSRTTGPNSSTTTTLVYEGGRSVPGLPGFFGGSTVDDLGAIGSHSDTRSLELTLPRPEYSGAPGVDAFGSMGTATSMGQTTTTSGNVNTPASNDVLVLSPMIVRGTRVVAEVSITVVSIFVEPVDWALTAREIYNDPRSPWSYAGLVPMVPTVVGKLGKAANRTTSQILHTSARQLQSKFKHAADFGVHGNYNPENAKKFRSAINQHINSADVQIIQGTYRGQPVTHYVDPQTGLNVMSDSAGEFVSGWKLSPQQLQHVITTGKLGGGG